jgi:hypothetical protein
LPNGKVLVAGGLINSGINGATASAEIYDPVAKTWSATGSMTTARALATATLLPNGTVLVAGGYCFTQLGSMISLASAEIYDPVAGTWKPAANMLSDRYGHSANLLPDGTVLVAGDGSGAEIYDPATGIWVATSNMIAGRSGSTATVLVSGEPLLAGGSPYVVLGPSALYQDLLSSSEIYKDLKPLSKTVLTVAPRQGSGTIAKAPAAFLQ